MFYLEDAWLLIDKNMRQGIAGSVDKNDNAIMIMKQNIIV